MSRLLDSLKKVEQERPADTPAVPAGQPGLNPRAKPSALSRNRIIGLALLAAVILAAIALILLY
ncbi:MAG: hypothetical protein KDI82_02470 [Gammaproteobacteria bacterium]|nr:hypothetical protein [Gammaproteobacteria bacterium]